MLRNLPLAQFAIAANESRQSCSNYLIPSSLLGKFPSPMPNSTPTIVLVQLRLLAQPLASTKSGFPSLSPFTSAIATDVA
jgi:hypothetical protein